MGWFWFAFSAGLPTLGSLLLVWSFPTSANTSPSGLRLRWSLSEVSSRLPGLPGDIGHLRQARWKTNRAVHFSLASRSPGKPKTAIGCLVRMINTAPQFGFLVFLPTFFTTVVGLRLSQWLQLLSYMFLSNIIANLLSGIVGDRLGWRRTVAYVGGIGCTVTTLLLYYVPVAHRGNFALAVVVAVLYGATLAGPRPPYRHHAALGAGK